jgi:thymidylate synthase
VALGVPFNIASYALLLTMMAKECNLTPGILVHTLGDVHIYLNHMEGLKLQLERTPTALPRLEIQKKKVLDYKFEDFKLIGYQPAGFIKFPIAV